MCKTVVRSALPFFSTSSLFFFFFFFFFFFLAWHTCHCNSCEFVRGKNNTGLYDRHLWTDFFFKFGMMIETTEVYIFKSA